MKVVNDDEVNWKKEFMAQKKQRDFYFEGYNRLIDELAAVRKELNKRSTHKMNINITEVKELEDGRSEVVLDLDDEAKKYLLNLGFMTALEKGLARVDALWKDDTSE